MPVTTPPRRSKQKYCVEFDLTPGQIVKINPHTLCEVMDDKPDEHVDDEKWTRVSGRRKWVVEVAGLTAGAGASKRKLRR